MSATNMAKRTAAGTLALATCLAGGTVALAGAARAEQLPNHQIIVVSGEQDHLIDAVNAAPLAGQTGWPVLLISDAGPTPVQRAWLKKRAPGWIYFVGGDAAISPEVRTAVIDAATIDDTSGAARDYRLAGDTRYTTNQAVITVMSDLNGEGFNG